MRDNEIAPGELTYVTPGTLEIPAQEHHAGRAGGRTARISLTSPYVFAASAVVGEITDPVRSARGKEPVMPVVGAVPRGTVRKSRGGMLSHPPAPRARRASVVEPAGAAFVRRSFDAGGLVPCLGRNLVGETSA
ncbi:hypothetical protein [Actinophytocola oryzae]|uniref:hypothetical protein n=1 Tax=Actinophytocola oryzae TaxID=502181 RepID=UPI00106333C9|nr:hypothetical protein [Actinophytocola oryzae]